MSQAGGRRALRCMAALAVACLSLLVFDAAHGGTAANGAVRSDASSSCAPETTVCTQASFPCPTSCSATAGPVTNVGLDQAVYVEVTGVPVGDELEIAYCSLAGTGTEIEAQPQCSSVDPTTNPETAEPTEYVYVDVASNQTILSIPTDYDPDIPGNSGIVSENSSQVATRETGSFFCDNAANPCGVEVMDIPVADVTQDGLPPVAGYSPLGHAVIFPVTFSQSGNGCGSAPDMAVDASYSVEQFLPAAGSATCNDAGGVIVLPTELQSVDGQGCSTGGGSSCPIEDVIDGTVPVTFTDDPEDPATLAELKAAGGKFAYIPIAVSATEIATLGEAGTSGVALGLDSYQLTPALAAGVMTQLWNSATSTPSDTADDICGQLAGKAQCKITGLTTPTSIKVETAKGKTGNLDVSASSSLIPKTETFGLTSYSGDFSSVGVGGVIGTSPKVFYGDTGFALLNPWPFSAGGSAIDEGALGSMWPSTPSGASYEATGWMCSAPNLQYTGALPFGGQATVQDILSGQQILADAEFGPVAAPVKQGNNDGLTPGVVVQSVVEPSKKCRPISGLPTDFSGTAAGVNYLYLPSSSPLTAAAALQKALGKYTSGGFAFSAMDSSEADFFGLFPASLQNAAGDFVSPSQQSITDALNDVTTNPDGTVSPNYDDTGDAGAYPLPMVTYALVSTSAQPSATQASELGDLLTNLVTYSHNGGTSSAPLPAGYVPLPSNLYSQALADITSDVVSPGGSSSGNSGGTGSGSAGTPAAASPRGAASTPAAGVAAAVHGGGVAHGSGASATQANGAGPSGGSQGASSSGNFVGHFITVTVGDNRYFIPGLLLFALLCLLAGPLLYLWPTLRKAGGAGVRHGAEGGAASSGPAPPEGG
jgi:hypothetical protein